MGNTPILHIKPLTYLIEYGIIYMKGGKIYGHFI